MSLQRQPARLAMLLLPVLLGWSALAAAQYFGKNVVRHEQLDFEILRTEHFDIYYYEEQEPVIEQAAQLAERWQRRLSRLLDHDLTQRQPLILYANHPHFRQTNTSPGTIGEGTGGFTEIFRNRVVLPFAGTLAETDHVLGHELVHAFQFDMTGSGADPERFGNIPGAIRLPLWLVEGMAEYLSLGPYDSHTSMWLRDMVAREASIEPARLNHPRFHPYRQGHGLIAFIGGRFGDGAVGRLLVEAAAGQSMQQAFTEALDAEPEAVLEDWQEEMKAHYGPMIEAAQPAEEVGRELLPARDGRDRPQLHLAPALSPDGSRVIYLAQRPPFGVELFLMDVETGEVLGRITRTALDPHFEALQFVRSAGDWSPDGERFVFATIRRGRPALDVIDGRSGERLESHRVSELGEIYNPVWSPNGRRIAFSGTRRGYTDLYVFDLETGALERLTDDLYSALQPAWAPDGKSLVFATDRFVADLEELSTDGPQLARIELDGGEIEALPSIPGARHINPSYGADATSIYFLADARGTSNIYRLDTRSGEIVELTNVQTGISGLTATSPALSVAGPDDTLAFTLFGGGGYGLMLIDDAATLEGTPLAEIELDRRHALLPPRERRDQEIARYLGEPEPPHAPVIAREDYRPRIRPEFISQVSLVAGGGSDGAFVGGGASVLWSDMLGDHTVLTQLQTAFADGEILRNTAALVGYQNRKRRINWSVIASQVPRSSGSFGAFRATIDGEPVIVEQARRLWEINRSLSGRLAYPFDRARRVELSTGYRRISFDAEERVRAFSLLDGRRVFDETRSLSTPSAVNLVTLAPAFVYDTSIFGAASPVAGQRARIELGGVSGDLTYFNPLLDYRGYWLPFENAPFTLAGRLLHFGRYGADAEDPRLRQLFLGQPTLVRGYGTGFNLISDPVIDDMQGSRIAVANVELRAPLFGPQGLLSRAMFAPIEANLFYDAGTAWTSDERPAFLGGDRSMVTSFGAGLRLNLAGIVLQLSYVNPVEFETQSWHWQFTLTPGF